MFKNNYITIQNIIWVIYYKQEKFFYVYEFFWIESVAEIFHLQMNILKLFITTFQGQSEDIFSLQRLAVALQRSKISPNNTNKEFHICNDFFQIVIQANLITLYITKLGYTNSTTFQTWLSCNNWPALLKLIKEKYLKPLAVHKLKQ